MESYTGNNTRRQQSHTTGQNVIVLKAKRGQEVLLRFRRGRNPREGFQEKLGSY